MPAESDHSGPISRPNNRSSNREIGVKGPLSKLNDKSGGTLFKSIEGETAVADVLAGEYIDKNGNLHKRNGDIHYVDGSISSLNRNRKL